MQDMKIDLVSELLQKLVMLDFHYFISVLIVDVQAACTWLMLEGLVEEHCTAYRRSYICHSPLFSGTAHRATRTLTTSRGSTGRT